MPLRAPGPYVCVWERDGGKEQSRGRTLLSFVCSNVRGSWGYGRALLTQHTFRGAVSMFSAFLMASVVDVSAGLASSSLVLGGDNEEDKPR